MDSVPEIHIMDVDI